MPKNLTDNASIAENQQETIQATQSKLDRDPQRLYAKYPKKIILTSEEAMLLGILFTDGCLSRKSKNCWRFYLSNTSFEIIQTFKDCMIQVFGLEAYRIRISQKQVNGKPFYKAVVDSGYCGEKFIAAYGTFRTLAFKQDDIKVYPPTRLPFRSLHSTELISFFLRAAFSCDGGVNLYVGTSRPRNYRFLIRNAYLSCQHPQLQLDYKELLSRIDINSKIVAGDNKVLIQGKGELKKFRKKVGFLRGVKVTQHSVFWQGWEKNQVLDLAMSSYGRPESILKLIKFN